MERVNVLINRLKEQLDEQVAKENLLMTAQMLVAELQHQHQPTIKSKVAITMPSTQQYSYQELATEVVLEPFVEKVNLAVPEPMETDNFIAEEEIIGKEEDKVFKQTHFFSDAFITIPTLPQLEKKELFELNDTMVLEAENNNTRWNENKVEVAAVLERTPIKDFKKAININDRYLFINELFRGDEAMYERSLKTIQGFSILPEATFWIQRELKLKLGWSEESQAVKLFDQLVNRRFS